jgi:hypothetical protein
MKETTMTKTIQLSQESYLYQDFGDQYYTAVAYNVADDQNDNLRTQYCVRWEILTDYDPAEGDESDACDWDIYTVYVDNQLCTEFNFELIDFVRMDIIKSY